MDGFLGDMDTDALSQKNGGLNSGPLDSCPVLDGSPDLTPRVEINQDLGNDTHGPHYDVMTSIPGGVDKTRVRPDGGVLGGTTHIGSHDMDW